MNPPYQSQNQRKPLYPQFIKLSINLLKPNGFLATINPPSYRNSDNKLRLELLKLNIKYIQMYSIKEGKELFNQNTAFDIIIGQNINNSCKESIIKDYNKIINNYLINQNNCIPSFDLEFYNNLIAKDNQPKVNIYHSRSDYGNDQKHISKTQDQVYKYPVIYSTGKTRRLLYASRIDSVAFHHPKVILGKASPQRGFYDAKGQYGVSNHCFAFLVDSDQEGLAIQKIIKTNKFKLFLESIRLIGIAIDWKSMINFKKDFYKYF